MLLDAYVGSYELTPNFVLTITREGDKLMGQATGQARLELEPTSETQFAVPSVAATVSFEKADGKVTGLSLVLGGRVTKAPRMK